jgi:DNA-binding response OmpR family regulator
MKVLKMKTFPTPFEILLVEDNKGDIGLITEFFIDSKIITNLHIAEDGDETLRFLYGKDKFSGSTLPDIIILDWNLPKKDGNEVLKEIKENNNFKDIPTIILTTSSAEKDIVRAYDLHANSYIVKPLDFDEFMTVIGSIQDFWFKVVTLPPKSSTLKKMD